MIEEVEEGFVKNRKVQVKERWKYLSLQ